MLRSQQVPVPQQQVTVPQQPGPDEPRQGPGTPGLDALLGEAAVAGAEIGTFAWDLVTGEVALDDRLVQVFGFDGPFDRTIASVGARLHPQDLPRVGHAFSRLVGRDTTFELEFRVVVPGAEDRWVLARGRLLAGPDGLPVRAVGAAFDATSRQQGEARTTRLLEAMPTAFFSLDPDWRFSYINAEGERLLGRPRAEIVGHDLWEMFPHARGTQYEVQYRTAVRTGRPVVFDAYYPPPLDTWYEAHAWPGPDGLAVYLQDVTVHRRARAQAEREARRAALLAQVSTHLIETLDAGEGLARLADLLVPALADWCVVSLLDEHGDGLRGSSVVGCAHVDPDARPLVERYVALRRDSLADDRGILDTLDGGEVLSLTQDATETIRARLTSPETHDLIEQLAPESALLLGLRARGRTTGVVSLFNGAGRGVLGPEDLVVAQEVAARAGLALDNARLYQQQRRLAEGFQRSLLTAPAEPDHVQIAVRYVPAAEAAQVGGDWYDAFVQRTGDTVVVIGDVAGHDSIAAASMAQLRSLLRGIAVATGAGPADLLREVDGAMLTLQSQTLATAVVARIEQSAEALGRRERTVRWSNAGHPPPLVVHPDGSVTALDDARPDLLLGVDPGTDRGEHTVTAPDGTTLVFFTDGLVERRDRPLTEGTEQLRRALESLAERDLENLCDEVLDLMLPPHPGDDVAIVAIRLHPQDRPRPSAAGPERVPPDVPGGQATGTPAPGVPGVR